MEPKAIEFQDAEYKGTAVKVSAVYISSELRDELEAIARDNDFEYTYEDSIRHVLELAARYADLYKQLIDLPCEYKVEP